MEWDIAENSAAGTKVGDPVTGTPYDDGDDQTDDTLSYTLTGDAANCFAIYAGTGQISVKQGTTLDFESATKSYTGKVNFTIQGQAAAIDLTIRVTDVQATIPNAPTVTRTASDTPMDPALDVAWTANANGLTINGYNVEYRKKAAAGEDPATWTLYQYHDPDDTNDPPAKIGLLEATATTFTLEDLEAGVSYEFRVKARTSTEDDAEWLSIGEGWANRPPATTGVGYYARQLDWGAYVIISNPVTTHFNDADGDTLTYSSSTPYPGLVSSWFNGASLVLKALNPTAAAGLNVSYRAHDLYGGASDDANYGITVVANETRSIAENFAADTVVGRAVAGTPYEDGDDQTVDSLAHTLTGDAADAFVIDSATGEGTANNPPTTALSIPDGSYPVETAQYDSPAPATRLAKR